MRKWHHWNELCYPGFEQRQVGVEFMIWNDKGRGRWSWPLSTLRWRRCVFQNDDLHNIIKKGKKKENYSPIVIISHSRENLQKVWDLQRIAMIFDVEKFLKLKPDWVWKRLPLLPSYFYYWILVKKGWLISSAPWHT